jgi:AmmeMemoRadiSam system protein A
MFPHALDVTEQAALVKLAGQAIARAVATREPMDRGGVEAVERAHPRLARPRGVFVTLYVNDQLRGCLGEIFVEDSLARTTARCAAHAAYADYRFAPVARAELAQLRFKISVLTPPEPLGSYDDIVLGRDGLILRDGGKTGVLLPEVPIEHCWDRRTFLEQLWRKAGLDPATLDSKPIPLLRFESQAFGSEAFPEAAMPSQ